MMSEDTTNNLFAVKSPEGLTDYGPGLVATAGVFGPFQSVPLDRDPQTHEWIQGAGLSKLALDAVRAIVREEVREVLYDYAAMHVQLQAYYDLILHYGRIANQADAVQWVEAKDRIQAEGTKLLEGFEDKR